jgi:hypothetical protein
MAASSPEWTTRNSGVLNRFGEECFFDSSLLFWTYTEREKQRLQDDLRLTGCTGANRLERRLERAILFGSDPNLSELQESQESHESDDESFDECNGDLDDDDDDESDDGDDGTTSTGSMVSMVSLDGISLISTNESIDWLDDIDQSE